VSTKIVMIHGRGQASDERTGANADMLLAYEDGKKRPFLAGLAKGLVLASRPPVSESDVIFPFYGNIFAQRIAEFESRGGTAPQLELAPPSTRDEIARAPVEPQVEDLSKLQAELLNDMAIHLNYDANTELAHAGRQEEIDANDLLRIPYLTGALQFLSRKTGVAGDIIRHHLADVAYYIGQDDMREVVLNVIRDKIRENTAAGDDLIIIGHSLGSVVAYDLLAATDDDTLSKLNVKLLVTAGCPLGLEVVKSRVLGKVPGQPPRVPSILPAEPGAWVNAYDVLDVVALIHPLKPEFEPAKDGQLVDQQTHNPSGPHAIVDYLADPDVAAPISRAMT
jgi:hypothetical protein